MLDVGREVSKREIIHAFVESNVKGNFDAIGLGVEPENVLRGIGKETEKDAKLGMVLQTTAAFTGRTNPHTTTESPKISEISLGTIMESFIVRRTVVFTRERILDT